MSVDGTPRKSRPQAELLVVVPTFNEADTLPRLVEQLRQVEPDADILVIDDNSPDGTGRVADELASKHACLQVIHRPGRQGLGSAHVRGLTHALEAGYRVAVTMDCDGTHDPRAIQMLLGALAHHDADIAVASRYTGEGGMLGWTLPRRVLSRSAHLATRALLGIHFDATNAFRAWRLERLKGFDFSRVKSPGYAFMFEMLFQCHLDGFHIVDMPARLPIRHAGYSKMSSAEMVRGLTTLARLTRIRVDRLRHGGRS
ncbi:MAG: polyprenol monophosphomannose synthase [Myxococcota bacterium]